MYRVWLQGQFYKPPLSEEWEEEIKKYEMMEKME